MFKNYLKIAIRNLLKHKTFSLINIFGLAIAIWVCIYSILWIKHELSYDKFHENFQNIYRINTEYHLSNEVERYTSSPEPAGPTLVEEFPEITHTARLWRTSGLIQYQDKTFNESKIAFTDPEYFDIFTIHTIYGNPDTMLDEPYSVVISEAMAKKYFGNENPMGKILKRNNNRDYTVTGVIQKHTQNTSFDFDFILSFNLLKKLEVSWIGQWDNINGETFILVDKKSDIDNLRKKIWNVANEHHPEKQVCNLLLQPLSELHLYNINGGGAIQYIYIFAAIAFIVLLIACINFMNLSTARSSIRAKEVGMRKISGANRESLIKQFFGESILLAFISLLLAIIGAELLLPYFNNLTEANVDCNFLNDFQLLAGLILLTILTGMFAGSYPAIILSSFKPLKVLKGNINSGSNRSIFRIILVILQFTLSIVLIISTLVVYTQMNFMKTRDLGFNKDNLIYLRMRPELNEKYDEFITQIENIPGVLSTTRAGCKLTDIGLIASGLKWEGQDDNDDVIFSFEGVDYNYIETCKMNLIAGRSFSKDLNDESNYILNESAIKRIGYADDPIDKPFSMWGRKGKIIGVVEDFNFQPANVEIDPLILTYFPVYFYYIYIKVAPENIQNTTKAIEKIWNNFVPVYPFEFDFMDDDFNKLYKTEETMGTLFKIFTGLAVFISCLGLFGLTSFIVERKTKEIGVRKVLGASVNGLMFLLIKDFLKWVLISIMISYPIAWWTVNLWLQNYAYKANLSPYIFIIAGISAIIIALLTVSFQTLKAATSNPADALKYE